MRWTRECCETGSALAGGQAVWSWHPDAGVKLVESNFRRRRWLTSPAHRGDHGVTVKPIARGMPGDSGEPVVTMLVCLLTHSHARLRVHRAPGIPCALFFRGANRACTTRAKSR